MMPPRDRPKQVVTDSRHWPGRETNGEGQEVKIFSRLAERAG